MSNDYLKKYRRDHILTQHEFAEKTGLTKTTVSNIENHKIRAGHKVLKAIMNECEIDLLEVVRLNENNKQI